MLQLQAPPEVLRNMRPITLGSSSALVVGQKVGRVCVGAGRAGLPGACVRSERRHEHRAHPALSLADTPRRARRCRCAPGRMQVYAIGNPFGLDHTLTSGIISGLNRELATGERRPAPWPCAPPVLFVRNAHSSAQPELPLARRPPVHLPACLPPSPPHPLVRHQAMAAPTCATSSRPMQQSIQATAAACCWTARGGWWASTPPSQTPRVGGGGGVGWGGRQHAPSHPTCRHPCSLSPTAPTHSPPAHPAPAPQARARPLAWGLPSR